MRLRAVRLGAGIVMLAAALALDRPGAAGAGAAGAGSVSLASHLPGLPAATASGDSRRTSMSADGRFVAFGSSATDLVSRQSDTNGGRDVFLFDRVTGVVTLVSHVPGNPATAGNGWNFGFAISDDASFVAFLGSSTNLVVGQDESSGNFDDVFLFERATGAVTLVTHVPGTPSRPPSVEATISWTSAPTAAPSRSPPTL